MGGFEHPPNVDAVEHLVREVMPQVWSRLGEVTLTIVGASTPAAVEALAGPQVEIAGWVPDLEPLFDGARALIDASWPSSAGPAGTLLTTAA